MRPGMGEPLLQLSAGPDSVGPLLRVVGELDLSCAELLRHRVLQLLAMPHARAVTLDLSGLRFCDVTGVNTLVALRAAADRAGTHLVLRDPPCLLRRLLHLADLTFLLAADLNADRDADIVREPGALPTA